MTMEDPIAVLMLEQPNRILRDRTQLAIDSAGIALEHPEHHLLLPRGPSFTLSDGEHRIDVGHEERSDDFCTPVRERFVVRIVARGLGVPEELVDGSIRPAV